MKRWFLFVAAASMIGMMPARGGTSLLEMVPKDIEGCVWLNFVEIMAHPVVREQLEKQQDKAELNRFRELFAKNGLDLYQAFQSGTVFGDRQGGGALLLQTNIPEEKFRKMFEEDNPLNTVGQVGGRTVYPFEKGGTAAYLRPDVIFCAQNADLLLAYQERLKGQGTFSANTTLNGYRRRINPHAAAWAVFLVNLPQGEQGAPSQNPITAIKGGSLALYLGSKARQLDQEQAPSDQDRTAAPATNAPVAKDGDKEDDGLRLVVRLACKDAQSANFTALSLNGMLAMGIGQWFADDQDLGMELSRILQIRPQQQDIVLDAAFTGGLIARIKTALENLANKPRTPRGGRRLSDDQQGEELPAPAPPRRPMPETTQQPLLPLDK